MTAHTSPTSDFDLSDASWIKSSYSGNGNNCVEIANLAENAWFKSSHSDNGTNCVEAADLTRTPLRAVAVRDSKNPEGPALLFTPAAFADFVDGSRNQRV